MQLKLGDKIRELRHRDGRTQETLADAFGVTSQAVSRWESNGTYPDMEIIPSIANFFGVSIDELFGYEGKREKKINALIAHADELDIQNNRGDVNLDECLNLLREGMAEFPGNEKIMRKLATVLSETGWLRQGEWLDYDDDGYIRHNFDQHRKNEYWTEAIKLFETLVINAKDSEIMTDSIFNLVLLYRNIGEYEKAIELANRLPQINRCREIMLATATDGKEQGRYLGEALLKMAYEFTEQFVYTLINRQSNFDTDMPIKKIKGLISLFHFICDDGNLGEYHREVCYLYLYLSRLQWEKGEHDEAFQSLDEALRHAKSFDILAKCDDPHFTAPLVRLEKCNVNGSKPGDLVKNLPRDWPMWCNPDYSNVKREMTADLRWDEWVEKTQSN